MRSSNLKAVISSMSAVSPCCFRLEPSGTSTFPPAQLFHFHSTAVLLIPPIIPDRSRKPRRCFPYRCPHRVQTSRCPHRCTPAARWTSYRVPSFARCRGADGRGTRGSNGPERGAARVRVVDGQHGRHAGTVTGSLGAYSFRFWYWKNMEEYHNTRTS